MKNNLERIIILCELHLQTVSHLDRFPRDNVGQILVKQISRVTQIPFMALNFDSIRICLEERRGYECDGQSRCSALGQSPTPQRNSCSLPWANPPLQASALSPTEWRHYHDLSQDFQEVPVKQ